MALIQELDMRLSTMTEEQKQLLMGLVNTMAPQPAPAQAPANPALTLEDYATNTFMRRKNATFSQNAHISYTNAFVRIFKYLGHIPMKDIRPVDINDFFLTLQTTETAQRKQRNGLIIDTGKPLTHASILKYYTVLHSMFADAYRLDEVIPHNPMDKVQKPTARKDDEVPEMNAYTVKEAQYMLQCLAKEPLKCRVMIGLLLDTGCRRGEIAGLKWQDVHFGSKTIKICNNLQYSSKKGVYNTTPKGKKSRVIDVDPALMDLLWEFKTEQTVRHKDGYCFVNNNGKLMSPTYATQYLIKFGKKYGIEKLHPHALRHTAASIELDDKFVDVIVNRFIETAGTADGVFVERGGAKLSYTEVCGKA